MHVFLLWDRANNFLVSLLMSKLKIDKNDEKKSALILYSLSCLLNEAGKIAVLTVFYPRRFLLMAIHFILYSFWDYS